MTNRDDHHTFQVANNIGLLGVTKFLGSKRLNLEPNGIPQQGFKGVWLHLSTYPTYLFPLFEYSAIYRSIKGGGETAPPVSGWDVPKWYSAPTEPRARALPLAPQAV